MKKYKVKGILVDSENTVSPYGVDIESELTKILSEQLAKEIDRDILRSLGLEPDRHKRRKNSINKIYKNVDTNQINPYEKVFGPPEDDFNHIKSIGILFRTILRKEKIKRIYAKDTNRKEKF